MNDMTITKAYRASLLHFHSDPDIKGDEAYDFYDDSLLIIANGHIQAVGNATALIQDYPDIEITDYSGHLIIPGLIDTQIHYPQVEVIASYGEQLLDWLNNYTFPAERQFEDAKYAREMAEFFEASNARNTRMICGKVMMDRNAPDYLCDTPESSYQDTKRLSKHGTEKADSYMQ
jgi:guanine deaminase